MKQLRYANLAPPGTNSPAKPKLSYRAENLLSKITNKERSTGQDLVGWIRRLPQGTTMRQELLRKFVGTGPGTVNELVELAIREGMVRAGIDGTPDQYGLSNRAYNALRLATAKPAPTKEDIRDLIMRIPAGTDVQGALIKLRNVGPDTAKELAKFAIREGFIKSREQESAGTASGPEYSI